MIFFMINRLLMKEYFVHQDKQTRKMNSLMRTFFLKHFALCKVNEAPSRASHASFAVWAVGSRPAVSPSIFSSMLNIKRKNKGKQQVKTYISL